MMDYHHEAVSSDGFAFVHLTVNLYDCKMTNSNRRAPKTGRKRLYFRDLKERLVNFDGTVVITLIL